MRQLLTHVGVLLAMVLIGTPAGLIFWFFRAIGLIRFKGFFTLLRALTRGGCLIIANHPSYLETLLFPILSGPLMLLKPRLFMYSTADKRIFHSMFFAPFRCIPIDRINPENNKASIVYMQQVLDDGYSLVNYVEGGLTKSPYRHRPHKPVQYITSADGTRVMKRPLTTFFPVGKTVVPVWIDVPFANDVHGFWDALWHWIRHRHTITFTVREPWVMEPGGVKTQWKRMADSILNP